MRYLTGIPGAVSLKQRTSPAGTTQHSVDVLEEFRFWVRVTSRGPLVLEPASSKLLEAELARQEPALPVHEQRENRPVWFVFLMTFVLSLHRAGTCRSQLLGQRELLKVNPVLMF